MGIARIVVTVVIVVAVLGGFHAYLWWRLVAGPFRSRRARVMGAGIILAVVLCTTLGIRGPVAELPEPIGTTLSWVGSLWIALMFYLLLVLLVLEPVRAVVAAVARRRDAREEPERTAHDLDRRAFLARATALTAGAVALGTVGYGVNEARSPRVKRVSITLPTLHPALNRYRIALLTDIHLSPTLRRPFVDAMVRTVNTLDVGAVAIVGDLVDGSVDELSQDAEALTGLRSAHGTYFVTGNHEYYSGAAEWVEYLPTLGIQVLRNRRIEIDRGGAGFDLAGVDDVTAADSGVPGHGADLAAALDGRSPDRPVVLLAHQPVQWPEAARRGVELQLSGHTHGGQLWPFTYGVRLEQPVVAGYEADGASQIYVSRGVGSWGPPVRVGAPPEISLIELRSAEADQG